MSVAAIDFIPAGLSLDQVAFTSKETAAQPFNTWLQTQMNDLNAALSKSDTLAGQLAAGETENLHHIMIGMEEAKIAFQLAVQVRNRVLEAYQDVLRMQI